MSGLFKWWCCRYMLRVFCVDCSFSDTTACISHKCRDRKYKRDRSGPMCEKENCVNSRKKNGIPRTEYIYYS